MEYKLIVVPRKWFPFFWRGATGITFGSYIFAEEEMWNRIDGVRKNAFLEHEMVHVKQQCSGNIVLYFLEYIFNARFRYQIELEAYVAQAEYLIHVGFTYDAVITSYARSLAGRTYFSMITYKEAITDLKRMVPKHA